MSNGAKVTVVSIKEPCSAGLKVGDSWVIKNKGCMVMEGFEGVCPEIVNTVFPACMTMIYGGKIPWENEKGEATAACPDPHSAVVVKIERIPAEK